MAEPESPDTAPEAEPEAQLVAQPPVAQPPVGTSVRAARTDRSPWNWLLLIPIVVPLLTPLYNHDSPRLWGFPMFYWLQFLFILLGVATTSVVYRMTRR